MSYRFEIWQACRQAMLPSRLSNYRANRKSISRGFETSRDPLIRCLIGQWTVFPQWRATRLPGHTYDLLCNVLDSFATAPCKTGEILVYVTQQKITRSRNLAHCEITKTSPATYIMTSRLWNAFHITGISWDESADFQWSKQSSCRWFEAP